MGVGYGGDALMVPEDERGLDSFDVDQAATNLGNVGTVPGGTPDYANLLAQQSAGVNPVDAGAPPVAPDNSLMAPNLDAPEAPQLAPPGATPDSTATVTNLGNPKEQQGAAKKQGEYPALPAFEAMPAPPQPPPLTGDPQKDAQANLLYQRQLADYHAVLSDRTAQLNAHAANVNSVASGKQAEAQKRALEQKQAELKQYEALRQQRQSAIDQAVNDRAAARKDLESGSEDDKLHGGRLVAAIAGAIGAAYQAMGSAQLGHPQQFENQALKTIDLMQKQKYQKRKDRLAAAGDSLLEARYNAKDSQEAHRAALNDLDASSAAEWKLIGLEAESQLKRLGAAKADIDRNEVVVKARQEQAKAEGQIHQREEGHEDQRAQAAATLKLAEANLGERKGEFRANLGERRAEFNLRREDSAAARAERERLAREKADEKKTKTDEGLAVRDGSGIVRGLAPSSRVVKPMQDRAIQYDDAIKSAEDLLAYRREHNILGALPTGDAYDRAVLAVAATTQANASDATTAHEAGTLKKMGLVDEHAIEKTIEHLKDRQAAFMNQLRPLDGPSAPPSERGGRVSLPPPEGKPAKAPKLNGADAEQMLDAHRKGEHSFDAILKANKLL